MTNNQEIIRCLNQNLLDEALIRLSIYDFDQIVKLFIEFCQPIVDSSKHLLIDDIDHRLLFEQKYDFVDSYKLTILIEIILNEFVVNILFDDKSYSMTRRSDDVLVIKPNRPLTIRLIDRNNGKGLYHCSNSDGARNEILELLKNI